MKLYQMQNSCTLYLQLNKAPYLTFARLSDTICFLRQLTAINCQNSLSANIQLEYAD